MERLKSITINKVRYPYKIDLFVLEKLQETWSSISEFERELKGFKLAKTPDGAQRYDENGEMLIERVHFSIKALNDILPLMVNEGIEIESSAKGKEFEPVDEKEFIRNCNISPYRLQELVVEEFDRCFEVKK